MNKLIWEELIKELAKISQLPDPIKYINTTIVPILFDCFQLKSLAFMKVLSIRFYRLGCGIADSRDATSTGSIYDLGWLLGLGGSNSSTYNSKQS